MFFFILSLQLFVVPSICTIAIDMLPPVTLFNMSCEWQILQALLWPRYVKSASLTLRTSVFFVQIFLLNILMVYILRLWYSQLNSVKPHHYCLKSPLHPWENCSYSLPLKFLAHFEERQLRKFNTHRRYWEKVGLRETASKLPNEFVNRWQNRNKGRW